MSVAHILVLLYPGRSIIVEFFKGLAISGIVTTSLIFSRRLRPAWIIAPALLFFFA